ncbi:MAG TPA: type II secretion system protein [Burkholderiales bacterium]|jgi:prepilin-type N-terminal cleavage/methylation domain-containing protein
MRRARGFTLVELAVALAVIALLLGVLAVPLNTQIDQHRINETQKQANLIVEAILGFAVTWGRLPCPAAATTANTMAGAGSEARTGTACTQPEGVVPWAALGVAETDAWGRRFTYRVTAMLADDPTGGLQASFALTDTGNLTVRASAAGVDIASNIAAMVVSHGKNGFGAFQTNGAQVAGAAGDELENADNDGIFVHKLHEPAFDDVLAWVSPNVLKSRMVAAGRLP